MKTVIQKRARDERAQSVFAARAKIISASGRLTLEVAQGAGVESSIVRQALRELAAANELLACCHR